MFKLQSTGVQSTDSLLQTTVHRGGAEIITPLAEEWRALCAEGLCDQPFYQPEWIQAYVCAFAPDQTLVVLTVRRKGKLRAILPLIEERSSLHGIPVNKLRSASNVHSCRFDVILGADLEMESVLKALWRQLQQMPSWSVIELKDVPAGGGGDRLLSLANLSGYQTGRRNLMPGPYISLPAGGQSFDEAMAHVNSGFRSKLRQYKRQLSRKGELRLQVIKTAQADQLDSFYQLEAKGWKGNEGTAIQNSRATRHFYDAVAQAATASNSFLHYRLELNGHLVAAYFGVYQKGQYFALKSAYDESFSRYTPGNLIVQEILTDLLMAQAQVFDFLGSWAEWKRRWSQQVRPQGNCYIFRPGAIGTALHRITFQVMPVARKLKHKWNEIRLTA